MVLLFSLAIDSIERMMTSQWLLKVTLACLRSCDWEFRLEAILMQTRFDVGTPLLLEGGVWLYKLETFHKHVKKGGSSAF